MGDHRRHKAAEALERAIAIDPTDSNLYGQLARTLRDLGDTEAQLATLDRGIDVAADPSDLLVDRSNYFIGTGDFESALSDMSTLVQGDPSWSNYVARASILVDLGRLTEAEADFNAAVRIFPDEAFAYQSRARFRADQDRIAAALDDIEAAISLEPDGAEFHETRAEINIQLGDLNAAIADQSLVISLRGSPFDIARRGYLHELNGNLDFALVDYTAALGLDEYLWARHRRAVELIELGHYEEAVDDLTVALAIQQEAWTFEMRARAYELLGRSVEAESDRRSADSLEDQ